LVLQCAQEVLSLFVLGVASKVQSVGGTTTFTPVADPTGGEDQEDAARSRTNSVFQRLAAEIVDAGLAHDITEAYAIVIPAFNHYGLLPTEPASNPEPAYRSTTEADVEGTVELTAPADDGAGGLILGRDTGEGSARQN